MTAADRDADLNADPDADLNADPDPDADAGAATAAAAKPAVLALGGGFMMSREAKALAESLGLGRWGAYFAGRCGVLGPVDADVVVAVAGFYPAEVVHRAWEAALGVVGPQEAAQDYARACAMWGRRRLAGLDPARGGRLVELLERVAGAADPAGSPLFAGWRALPRPDDAPARVAHLCHLLREHRGAAHLMAVLVEGLTPLQALVAGPHGAGNATFFGWSEPYPEADDAARTAHARAETRTDAVAGRAYAVLDAGEREELVTLLAEADLLAAAAG